MNFGQPQAQMASGQDQAATMAGIGATNTQNAYNNNQVSSWASGLSGAVNLAQVAGSAGWKPSQGNPSSSQG